MILSDLDETLLVNHHIPLMNREAIQKARQKGVKVVPATGRSFQMIQDILEELETKDIENEYSICFNGGLIVENKDAKILHFCGLTFDEAKYLFDLADPYHMCVLIFTLEGCYLFRPEPTEIERKKKQKAVFHVIDDYNMDFLKDEHIVKMLYVKPDMDYLKNVEKELHGLVCNKYSVSFSSGRYLEFNALGVTKGNALHWLADHLGMSSEEVIAIGDNYNDQTMIEQAGLGACVKSAHDDIQKISDYVTEADYDEGAVKEVIERFVL